MNHIDRSLWSPSLGSGVLTSDPAGRTACAHGLCKMVQSRKALSWRPLTLSLMLAWGVPVHAVPSGGVVTAGSAVIGAAAEQMTVTQQSARVAIEWQSFGIAAGQSVRFLQPDRSSVALNRVVGGSPSTIMGSLSSNGQVFLVNPSGILFGPSAAVNVGGLVASTLRISDTDFNSGRLRFAGDSTGTVVNQGVVHAAEGGYVALLGAQVTNQGQIVAQKGTVALAAGEMVTLDVSGDQLLRVAIEKGVADALLSNSGLLQADGGQVLLSTQAAGLLLSNAVNNTGIIQAQTLDNRQGTVVLLASMDSGTVQLQGQVDVRGGHLQAGGRVVATGHQVALLNAQINASGDAGGGVVLIGGDEQGRNPNVPSAFAVHMSADSRIQADALVQGHGGRVVLWSEGSTRALGRFSARGGPLGGDGGLVETSGHDLDIAGARVDTLADRGQTGNWLLDPADITISSAATSDGAVSGGVFAPNSGVNSANIQVADLVTALSGTNVTVTTQNTGVGGTAQGDIHVNAAVTWTHPTTLTLNAARDVNVNQAITGTNGSLVVNAGGNVTVAAAVTTTTGSLSFTALQDVNLNAATTITTGHLTATAGRNVNVAAPSTVTTGNVVLRADNDGSGPGVPAGTVSITCGVHCLTVGTGELSIRFNPVSYASTSSEILAYAGKLTGGATLDAKAWVFGRGDNKVYDGNTSATVSGLLPDVTSVAPPVSLGAVGSANFDTKHVGTDKPIRFTTTFSDAAYALFAVSGSPVGTYQALADVTARPLTVTAVTDARVYNGTTSSVGSPVAVGVQPGDTLTGTLTQVFASKDVMGVGGSTLTASGTYVVIDGHAGANYAVSVITAPGTITPAPLTITASDVSKVYGQTPALTGFSASGLVGSETVGQVTLTSPGQTATARVDASPFAITASDAAGGTFNSSNYAIEYTSGQLVVLPVVSLVEVPVVLPVEVPVVLPDETSVLEPMAPGVVALPSATDEMPITAVPVENNQTMPPHADVVLPATHEPATDQQVNGSAPVPALGVGDNRLAPEPLLSIVPLPLVQPAPVTLNPNPSQDDLAVLAVPEPEPQGSSEEKPAAVPPWMPMVPKRPLKQDRN